jgi:hypothetical protein
MIYEDCRGVAVPRLPRDANGVLRVADGQRLFDLDQAAEHFSRSADDLRTLWQCTWDDALQPADPNVVPARVRAERASDDASERGAAGGDHGDDDDLGVQAVQAVLDGVAREERDAAAEPSEFGRRMIGVFHRWTQLVKDLRELKKLTIDQYDREQFDEVIDALDNSDGTAAIHGLVLNNLWTAPMAKSHRS